MLKKNTRKMRRGRRGRTGCGGGRKTMSQPRTHRRKRALLLVLVRVRVWAARSRQPLHQQPAAALVLSPPQPPRLLRHGLLVLPVKSRGLPLQQQRKQSRRAPPRPLLLRQQQQQWLSSRLHLMQHPSGGAGLVRAPHRRPSKPADCTARALVDSGNQAAWQCVYQQCQTGCTEGDG